MFPLKLNSHQLFLKAAKMEDLMNEREPKNEELLASPKRVQLQVEEEEKPKKEEEKEEVKEGERMLERKSCVKDENGFTYYKCRFCGLTFNFMVPEYFPKIV